MLNVHNGSRMGLAVSFQALVILALLFGSAGVGAFDGGGWAAAKDVEKGGQIERGEPVEQGSPVYSRVDAQGITLTWQADPPTVTTLPGGALRLGVAGFTNLETPGQPRLPVASVLAALPPGAQPSLEILDLQAEFLALDGELERALAPAAAELQPDGSWSPAMNASPAEPGLPTTAAYAVVMWEPIGKLAGVNLARLSFYPVLPKDGGAQVTELVSVRFNFGASAAPAVEAQDAAAQLLRQVVINPQHAQVSPIQADRRSPLPALAPGWIIQTSVRGLTQLSYANLQAAGFPVASVNPQNLHILHDAQEVDAEWDGDGDAVFEPGERLLFYADPQFNRWANYDTYLLAEGSTPGARMGARSASPNAVLPGRVNLAQTFEENLIYTPRCYCGTIPAGYDGERWAWKEVSLPNHNPVKTQVQLANVDLLQPGKLTVHLVSFTETIQNPDHKVQIYWNAVLLGEETWNGKKSVSFTYDLPAGQILNGANELALNLPGLSGVSQDGMWLDAFELQMPLNAPGAAPTPPAALIFTGDPVQRAYQIKLSSSNGLRAYQVTDPIHPLRLTDVQVSGAVIGFSDPNPVAVQRYQATTAEGVLQPLVVRPRQNLPVVGENGFNGVAYLAISPLAFASGLTPLLNARQTALDGASVQTLQPIYDTYAFGRPDPQAIRDYLDDAYHTWPTRPQYVLLVGDGTYDPKGYLPTSHPSYLPPYLAMVDPWAGETAADNLFVAVDGADNLPDMLLGRLPVNSLAETQTVVNKILVYEGQALKGDWTKRVTLVADDADSAGDFIAYQDQLAADTIGAPYTANKLYFQPPVTAAQMHTNVLQSFQDGALAMVFFGHSSYHQWAIENFLHISDTPALSNGVRTPIVLEMTCFTSEFQLPDLTALDEALLLKADGGAAATWGMSGLGLSNGHFYLAQGFMRGLLVDQEPELGQLTLLGKLNLLANVPAYSYMIDTFTLLGDPAMQANAPYTTKQSIFMPIIAR